MTQDSLARDLSAAGGPPDADEAIYDALVAALRSTARGRAFLDEYARRCRAADIAAALAALARIEALLTRERSAPPPPAAHDKPAPADMPTPRRRGDELLAQVMALSPEERIALFS